MLISRVTLVTWGNLVNAQVNIRVIASGQRRIYTFRVTRRTSNRIYVYAFPRVSLKNARLIGMRLTDSSTLMWATELTTHVDVKVFKEGRSRAILRYFRKSVNNYWGTNKNVYSAVNRRVVRGLHYLSFFLSRRILLFRVLRLMFAVSNLCSRTKVLLDDPSCLEKINYHVNVIITIKLINWNANIFYKHRNVVT